MDLTDEQAQNVDKKLAYLEAGDLGVLKALIDIEENTKGLLNKPEVQKVEVINQPDHIINVSAPEVKIPPIIVPEQKPPIINTDGIENKLENIDKSIKDKPTVENPIPVVLVYEGEKYKSEGKGKSKDGGQAGLASAQLFDIADSTKKIAGEYAVQLDDVTTTNVTYVGFAHIGTATSSALWQVRKIDESGSPITLTVKWADGNALFDNVWSDRATLNYS